jgi:hypothetical protein
LCSSGRIGSSIGLLRLIGSSAKALFSFIIVLVIIPVINAAVGELWWRCLKIYCKWQRFRFQKKYSGVLSTIWGSVNMSWFLSYGATGPMLNISKYEYGFVVKTYGYLWDLCVCPIFLSHICKPFVIPYQYPTLILVRSDLTFTVSNPKKMIGHKIRMHHSKFRPNKNQCRQRKIPQHPILDRANSYVHWARTSTFHSILPWKCTILISDTG